MLVVHVSFSSANLNYYVSSAFKFTFAGEELFFWIAISKRVVGLLKAFYRYFKFLRQHEFIVLLKGDVF